MLNLGAFELNPYFLEGGNSVHSGCLGTSAVATKYSIHCSTKVLGWNTHFSKIFVFKFALLERGLQCAGIWTWLRVRQKHPGGIKLPAHRTCLKAVVNGAVRAGKETTRAEVNNVTGAAQIHFGYNSAPVGGRESSYPAPGCYLPSPAQQGDLGKVSLVHAL